MSSSQPVIIVKKKRHGSHGHHGGAWKVAYADFVTAMMAFFLVMWLVAQRPAVKTSVAGYFRDPGAFETTRGGVLTGGSGMVGDAAAANRPADLKSAREALERAAEHLREALARVPSLASIKDRIEITVTAEGLRIELLETNDSSFFQIGSAEVLPQTVELLTLIAKELGTLEHKIAIEGHTDSRRYLLSDTYTNWELSVDRANAARRVMVRHGLRTDQIEEVRGYADMRLKTPNAPLDARNRRISIVVRNGV